MHPLLGSTPAEEAKQPLLPNSPEHERLGKKPQLTAEQRRRKRSPGSKLVRVPATVLLFVLLPLSFLLSFICQLLAWVLLFPVFLARPALKCKLQGLIFRFFQNLAGFYLNPFWSFKRVRNCSDPEYSPKGRTLVMCNHVTGADPWICNRAFFPWEMKWVYKADLHKIPVAGQVVQLAYDHPLYFTGEKGGWGTKPGAVKHMMDAVTRMGTEFNIGTVVFPEGTRSRTGQLQPFKDGFFRFAIEHDWEILPCVAHNNQSLWPLGTLLFGAGTVYFSIGDPMRPLPGESVSSLKARVRREMILLLEQMPLWDPEVDEPMAEDAVVGTRGEGLTGVGKGV